MFGDIFRGQEENPPEEPAQQEAHQDELDRASIPSPSIAIAANLTGPRCVNGEEEKQVPIAQEEEESHQEEDPLAVIRAVAFLIHFHRHLQVLPLHSHQEEQVIQAALHRLHLQQHLQQIEQLTRGHRQTDPENHCQSCCYFRTTKVAAF